MSEVKTIVVKFLKSNTPYVKGDIAGVPAEEFEKLEKAGVVSAVKVTAKPESGGDQKYFKHIISEEDLENNPDFVDLGLKVGEEIEIPEPNESMKLDDLKAIAEKYNIDITGLKSKKEVAEAIKQYETK